MKKNTIRNALVRMLWSGRKNDYEVVVVDRLSPGGLRIISGRCIERVDPRYIHVRCPDDYEEVLIPLHRVVSIRRGGEVEWSRYRS